MANYLVTSQGFIASHLTRYLLDKGNVFVTGPTEVPVPAGATLVATQFQKLEMDKLPPMDCVFHLAACTDTTNLDNEHQDKVNYSDAYGLAESAWRAGCNHFVYASSASVYGSQDAPQRESDELQPLNAYAASKANLDGMFASFYWPVMPVAGLRFSNVYGPGEEHKGSAMSYLHQMVRQHHETGRVRLFRDGEQKRDWVHVSDVVRACWLAHESRASGVFNVGSGVATSFNEIARLLGAEIDWIDNPHAGYQEHTCLDLTLSRNTFQYWPQVSIVEGIEGLQSGLRGGK